MTREDALSQSYRKGLVKQEQSYHRDLLQSSFLYGLSQSLSVRNGFGVLVRWNIDRARGIHGKTIVHLLCFRNLGLAGRRRYLPRRQRDWKCAAGHGQATRVALSNSLHRRLGRKMTSRNTLSCAIFTSGVQVTLSSPSCVLCP